jgi:RNA-directed DNA polymerase
VDLLLIGFVFAQITVGAVEALVISKLEASTLIDWLVRFVKHRIGDPRIIRLIQKWLRAGILEDGVVTVSDKGAGQGSVASPLLANILPALRLRSPAMRWRRREATDYMIIVRYATISLSDSSRAAEARRFLEMMRARLKEFSLSLHPNKNYESGCISQFPNRDKG